MKPLSEYISNHAADYLGLASALEEIRPLSEAGRALLKTPPVFVAGEEAELAAHHARIGALFGLFDDQPEMIDRLRHYLRGLPHIGGVWDDAFGQAEFALLAAFRRGHHGIRRALAGADSLAGWLDLAPAERLDGGILGDPGKERFYLEDGRSETLSDIRGRIRGIMGEVKELEEEGLKFLAERYGLPESAGQWVVDRADGELCARLLDADDVVLAAENVESLRFAPRPDEKLALLKAGLAGALEEERSIESGIYSEMEAELRKSENLWKKEARKLADLDLLLALAELARKWKAKAPVVMEGAGPILEIRAGRHEGVRAMCERSGAEYIPLDLELDASAAVLSGSNMGGKTVALQTVGWLQTLTQLGLYTPAEHLRTRLYSRIAVTSSETERMGGLSSFGRELEEMALRLPERGEALLYIMDEPGKATRIEEGRAIVTAALEALERSPSLVLCATHLDGLNAPGIVRLRMAGLNREALAGWRAGGGGERPALPGLMDYRVLRVGADDALESDALDIAELLGLERGIVERARDILKQSGEDGNG